MLFFLLLSILYHATQVRELGLFEFFLNELLWYQHASLSRTVIWISLLLILTRIEVDHSIICWRLNAGRQARLWDALGTLGDVRQLFRRLVEGSEALEAASLALL